MVQFFKLQSQQTLFQKKSLFFALLVFLSSEFVWSAAPKDPGSKTGLSAENPSCSVLFIPMKSQLVNLEKVYHSLMMAGIDFTHLIPGLLDPHAFFPELSGISISHIQAESRQALAMGVSVNSVFVRDFAWKTDGEKEGPSLVLGELQKVPVTEILTDKDLSQFFFQENNLIHLYTKRSEIEASHVEDSQTEVTYPSTADVQTLYFDQISLNATEKKTYSIDLAAYGYRPVLFKSKKKFQQNLLTVDAPYETYVLLISLRDSSIFRILRIQKKGLAARMSAPLRFERGSSIDYVQHDIVSMDIRKETTRRGRKEKFVWTFLDDSSPAEEVSNLFSNNYVDIDWVFQGTEKWKR